MVRSSRLPYRLLLLVGAGALVLTLLAWLPGPSGFFDSGGVDGGSEDDPGGGTRPGLALWQPTSPSRVPDAVAAGPRVERSAIRVTTFDARGNALAGANVRVCRPPKMNDFQRPVDCVHGTTGPDGVVALVMDVAMDAEDKEGFGRLSAWASSADGTLAARRGVPVTPGASVTLVLLEAAMIEGRVVGLGTAEERAKAAVRVYCPEWPEAPGSRYFPVDEQGRFRVEGALGFVSLNARAFGRASSPFWSTSEAWPGTRHEVNLEIGPPTATGHLHIDVDGRYPIPSGVMVYVTSADRSPVVVLTGPDGRLDADCLLPGMDTKVVVNSGPPGFRVSLPAEFAVPYSDWLRGARLSVPEAARPVFRVTDADGHPVTGLDLTLQTPEQDSGGTPGVIDPTGLWAPLDGAIVAPGEYQLTSRGHVAWQGRLEAGAQEGEVRLPPDLSMLCVRMVDWAGVALGLDGIRHFSTGMVPADDSSLATAPVLPPDGFQRFTRGPELCFLVSREELRSHRPLLHVRHGGVFELPTPDREGRVIAPAPRTLGAVRVVYQGPPGEIGPHGIQIHDADRGRRGPTYGTGIKNGVGEIWGVRPGSYRWTARSRTGPLESHTPVDVQAGVITTLAIDHRAP